jgi:small subunit ribosomal protein S16
MLKMRLQRIGRKNDPAFRLIVTDSRRGPKSGRHIDHIGSYNPKLSEVRIDGVRAKEWIAKGVQVSDTVHNLLVAEKIIDGKKKNVLPRKSPIVQENKDPENGASEMPKADAEETDKKAEATEEEKGTLSPETVPETSTEETTEKETKAT